MIETLIVPAAIEFQIRLITAVKGLKDLEGVLGGVSYQVADRPAEDAHRADREP